MATAATKGYDCEFISQVPNDYKCPVCKCVLRDPQRVSCCEELYCRVCIEPILEDKRPCPKCGCNNDNRDISISPGKKTKRQVDQLRCRCPNQRQGCEWDGEVCELDIHLNENPTNDKQLTGCKYTRVQCQNCQEMLPRNEMGDHLENVCQNRPFNCQYCGHHDTYKQVMTNHLPECPQQPVECPNGCGLSSLRQNLATHKAEECPKTMIKCEVPGCEERRERERMPEHIQEYSAQHVQLLSQKVRELEEEKKQREQKQNERHLPITVTMPNYEQLLTGRDPWMSRLLYTQERGYAIFLSVYVAGYGLASLTSDISVYVNITRGEYDEELEWPCQLSIEVSLLSQEGSGKNETKIFNIQARKAGQSRCQGWQRFIKERTAWQQYVKDNCLKFKVSNITERNEEFTEL